MGRLRARTVCATLAIAGGLVLRLRGQVSDESGLQILQQVGLPAVDEGLLQDDSHTPLAPETRRRAALRDALLNDRIGASGTHYRAGRVIVRFRDEAAMPDRRSAVRSASDTGEIAARPSYADFDVVRIDPSEDAEEAAAVLSPRPEGPYPQVPHPAPPPSLPHPPPYPSPHNNPPP